MASRTELTFKSMGDYKPCKKPDMNCKNCAYCVKNSVGYQHISNLDMFKNKKVKFPILTDNLDFPVKPDFGCKFFKSKK